MRRDPGLFVAAAVLVFMAVTAGMAGLGLLGAHHAELVAEPMQAPGRGLPLGSDALGRDLLARTVQAARVSLGAGLLGAALTLVVGTGLGLGAGLAPAAGRPRVDAGLVALADLFSAVPPFVTLLAVGLLLGGGTGTVGVAVAAAAWPVVFRSVRQESRRVRDAGYCRASEVMGASEGAIAREHVLPHLAPLLGTAFVLQLGWAIQAEALLGWLGLSHPELPSWGRMIAEAVAYLPRGLVLPLLTAAVPLTVTVLAAQLLADRLSARS